jgi:hypothetical protein
MQAQTALVRANRGVKLYAETPVDLHLAAVIHPGNPELDGAFGLYDAVNDAGLDKLGMLFHYGFKGF